MNRSLLGFLSVPVLTATLSFAAEPSGAQAGAKSDRQHQLLNVSYDPTRELYRELNTAFAAHDKGAQIRQSHGGSSSQARAVIDGLPADVVTLALPSDVEALHGAGLLAEGWRDRLPNRSSPYTSTIVFVVRKGNPKEVRDWADLLKGGVGIVTPHPKSSGNGKLAFLAAWGSVIKRGGSEDEARAFVGKLYRQVVSLDPAAREATLSFAKRNIGDVHLTWENEARLEAAHSGGALEIVYPKTSILAEPVVAVLDENAKRHETQARAEAYARFLFSPEAQDIIARHFYRPADVSIAKKHADVFPEIDLFPITLIAKNWQDAERKFFSDDGVYEAVRTVSLR